MLSARHGGGGTSNTLRVLFVLPSSCMDLRSAAMGIPSSKRRQSLHKEERLSKALFDFIDMHFGRKVWTTDHNEHVRGHCTHRDVFVCLRSRNWDSFLLGQPAQHTTYFGLMTTFRRTSWCLIVQRLLQ